MLFAMACRKGLTSIGKKLGFGRYKREQKSKKGPHHLTL